MDVRRDYPPGGRGTTPQDTYELLTASRVGSSLADFASHDAPKPRVDDTMGRPALAGLPEPGYFRDDSMLLVMNGAVSRMQPEVMRAVPSPKTLGGYDPEAPE
jgi:hypothetical protein